MNTCSVVKQYYFRAGQQYARVLAPYVWVKTATEGDLVIDPSIEITTSTGNGKDTFILEKSAYQDYNYGGYTIMMVGSIGTNFEQQGLVAFDLS